MTPVNPFGLSGSGLGLRRALFPALHTGVPDGIDFFEVSPENWVGVGGRLGKQFRRLTERYRFVAHGLALSLGGPAPLDTAFLFELKRFLDGHDFALYTEHLSFCSDEGHLYDLYPIPFTEQAVKHVAGRIRRTQDILERRIAVENASYYVQPPEAEMNELAFINAVLTEADCHLHLDVNNIYVNSVNHGYDPLAFLRGLPGERIVYGHVAGHEREPSGLIIDTHGQNTIEPVWDLLAEAYRCFGVFPTLVERDSNIPPLSELLSEVERIRTLQSRHADCRSTADITGVAA
ncbi:MAG: HvfB family MNIO-type RiPP peptide maturase [Methylomicrobium sp.]